MATIRTMRPRLENDPDPVFSQIRFEAEEALRREPELGGLLATSVLNHATLEQAVAYRLAARLSHADLPGDVIRQNFLDFAARDASLGAGVRAIFLPCWTAIRPASG